MLTLDHVEDYLEYLSGYSTQPALKNLKEPNFRLARYDINVVNNMSSNTSFGIALTDRQADLAVKLIKKYKRQFQKHEVDISPIETDPQYRISPRRPNRDKIVWFKNGQIMVKFPYNNEEIKDLQQFREESCGKVVYNKNSREWVISPTETNIEWIVNWAGINKFDVDKHVKTFYLQLQDIKQKSFSIKLIKSKNNFEITNSEKALNEFIEKEAGGFGFDNINKLVDYAGICGYEVSTEVLQLVNNKSLKLFGPHYEIHISPTPENLNSIFDYAEATNRYPICIYNPTMFDIDLSRFDTSDVVIFDQKGTTNTPEYNPYMAKVIYAKTIPSSWNFPVPLLVTTFEMMVGGRRQDWTKRAEKIIYYGTTKIKEQE